MHEPVLLKETCENLHIKAGEKYIDATLGAGGHTREILKLGGEVLGIDQDKSMIEIAYDNLKDIKEACPSFKLVYGNFKDIDLLAHENGFYPVAGILMDLGVSSFHFDDRERGFSFRFPDAELDMRLDKSLGVKASDLLNVLPEVELTNLLESRGIAKRIIEKRKQKPFKFVADLLEIFPKKTFGKVHPATKAFMDLRIAVNMELSVVTEAIPKALSLLKSGGVLAVISFHSGEDAIVKKIFSDFSEGGGFELVTKKPLVPKKPEVENNPKSRSAKLRVIKKK